MVIGFIGCGKVGFSLGKYFSLKGITLSGYYSKFYKDAKEASKFTNSKAYENINDLARDSSIIFITTPDDSIHEVLQRLSNFDLTNKIICHTSGSLTSSIFLDINNSDAFAYSIHPIFPFSDKYNSYKTLQNASFSIEGPEEHIPVLKAFIQSLGNKSFTINKDDKALYHLASVTVSNLVLSLINTGCSYLSQCGISENDALQALLPLIQNNIDNIKTKGFISSLTGPIERNDLNTVKQHIGAVPTVDVKTYKNLSLNLLSLSEEKHSNKDYSKLKEFLKMQEDN
ncbi:DUF2520 domain-containing protein [Clostridium tagluense]|uniref:Rossmann-like and DUF2520 domain-containing protein n=1 Tax=Clostridium tagluense TaxID=360422 RepID=UPI001C0D5884|nr:Rossmann-like and DUF2520 domain-containing protein [Clostridium tagluense]MBU3130086.1 DUF2520 domain-containing protein [Clostridium tagluense]MCB2313745.1 DUF2520 domain-containing protein [Clostridium tagluense]MCB2318525.1 DUF2520 domain-containing protein [Clostridium tagluense]MCB2323407.1 DUF2520 domain-containing protein [Clostridium tagluense]MCB2328315.1 DUF2520 domain-containing protein [Clostridium tagluense]